MLAEAASRTVNTLHGWLLMPMRKITASGFNRTKDLGLDHKPVLKAWRAAWDGYANGALEAAGLTERIDHRTLEAQKAEPRHTREVHPSRIPQKGDEIAAEYIEHPSGYYSDGLRWNADVQSYNSSLDLGQLVVDVVNRVMRGDIVGMVEAGVTDLVHMGLLPGAALACRSVPATAVRASGGYDGRPASR